MFLGFQDGSDEPEGCEDKCAVWAAEAAAAAAVKAAAVQAGREAYPRYVAQAQQALRERADALAKAEASLAEAEAAVERAELGAQAAEAEEATAREARQAEAREELVRAAGLTHLPGGAESRALLLVRLAAACNETG